MTKQQKEKADVLFERFKASAMNITTGGLGLSDGWITLVLLDSKGDHIYTFGIDVDGSSHS